MQSFGAPVLFVKKKDGGLRMCCDYRALNKITVKNAFPLPRIDDLLDKLAGSKMFSSLDLTNAYMQVRLTEQETQYTAFKTPFGLYEFRVIPFGVTNAPQDFSAMLSKIFEGYLGRFVLLYLDDILVFSKTPEEHMRHLELVLQRLREHQLYVKRSKCEFNKPEVHYLGFVVSAQGVRVNPRKTQVVQEWPTPKNVKELRSFLGLSNYFRRFIQGYSTIVLPLHQLTRSGVKFHWTAQCNEAFEQVKYCLTHAPVLTLPDFSKPFEIIADASGDPHRGALGAVLMQEGRVVAYESRRLTDAELRYITTEQEMLALVHALKTWRCYVQGVQFRVVTDHQPNTYFETQNLLNRRQARWLEFLSQFQFGWEWRPGCVNVADPLRRIPCPEPTQEIASILGGIRVGRRQAAPHSQCATPPESGLSPSVTGSFTPLVNQLVLGYAADPDYKNAHFTAQLTLTNGLWYKGEAVAVPAVPAARETILQELHAAPYAGHFSVNKTESTVRRLFWWPELAADVKHFVQHCECCQRNKTSTRKPQGPLRPMPIPQSPWESVGVDFVVALPMTKSGYDAIAVFVDRLTKQDDTPGPH